MEKERWQPLAMIPVLFEIIKDMLISSENQLIQLKEGKEKRHFLKKNMISRMIQFHEDQSQLLPKYLEQCKIWRTYELNSRQKFGVSQIESHVKSLIVVNETILFLSVGYEIDNNKEIVG